MTGPIPLPEYRDPGEFGQAIAEQLWMTTDPDQAGYRVLERADAELSDDQLDGLASAVDRVRSGPHPTRITNLTVADPSGLSIGQLITVTGVHPPATLVIRVHCAPVCLLEGIEQ